LVQLRQPMHVYSSTNTLSRGYAVSRNGLTASAAKPATAS
jgi:hypothetical protein